MRLALAAFLVLTLATTGAATTTARTIAFHADPGGADDVFALDPATGSVRRLTTGLEQVATPIWSPDGKRLAFVARARGSTDVFVMDADGGGAAALTRNQGEHYDVAWSPDGKKLAFACCGESDQSVYVMNADGSNRTRLATRAGQPRWSPDGARIAYLSFATGSAEIAVMRSNGTQQRRLTHNRVEDADPAWSQDGRSIAFDSRRVRGRSQIFVMNADGTRQRRLATDRWIDQQPTWSPDGRRVLFTSYRNRDPLLRGIGNAELVVVNVRTGVVRNLTRTPAWEGDGAWSPDGREIAFAARRNFGVNGLFRLEVMRADGSGRHGFKNVVALGSNSCCPAWRP